MTPIDLAVYLLFWYFFIAFKRRIIDEKEARYLFALYRGLYLKEDVKKGSPITLDNVYAAIPFLQEKSQISSREFFDGKFKANKNLKKDSPLFKFDLE